MVARVITSGGPSGLPLGLIAQAARKLTRHELEALTERLIEELDRQDGDPDSEDACDLEDDFTFSPFTRRHYIDVAAGCPISDPDIAVDDVPCDPMDEDPAENDARHLPKVTYERESSYQHATTSRSPEDI